MWDANVLNRGEGLKYFSYAAYLKLRDNSNGFSQLACTRPGPSVNLPDGRTVGIQAISGNFFSTLGVDALLGRAITPADDVPGAPPVLVIGYNVWQTTFGGDSSVLNRTLKVGNIAAPIVGVLPPDFFGLDPAFRYSAVMAMQPALVRAVPAVLSDPHNWNGCQAILGILRSGVPEEQARAESEELVRQTIEADPPREPWEAPHMRLTNLGRGFDTLRKAALQPFKMLVAVAGLILLIACSNVAGMLLAHGMARQKEIATRLALGATHGRMIRQLMTETLVLSAFGGLAGILIAYAAAPLLPKLFQQFNYYQFNNLGVGFAPDVRVLLFSIIVAALTGVLFGLMPALRTTRAALVAMIKMSNAVPGRFRFASGKTMLAAQVALAMVLLTGAGLLIRTLWNLQAVPMGYDPSGILYFTADTTSNRREFVSKVMTSLEALPGVSSATASIWPLFTSAPDSYVQVCVSSDQPKNFDDRFADSDLILPRFFETWRVPILRGRDFRSAESSDSVIVNEAFVKRYFGAGDPLGTTVRVGVNCSLATVVGVVANSTDRPRIAPRPFVYKPYAYQPTQLTFTIRTFGDLSPLIPSLRRIVADLGTRVFDPVTTGTEYRDRTMIQEQLFTNLLSGFGVLALLIASVGIYGATIYMVARRTPEIGIRMSLGAQRPDVIRLIVAETLIPVVVGIGSGIVIAFGLARFVAAVLFGVSAGDPWVIAGAAALLAATAVLAAAVPSYAASRLDPIQTLRYE